MARIIFAGYLVRYPAGGYAWQMAHYLLGLRSLGHDIWFYEDTGELNCDLAYNPLTNEFATSYEYGIKATANFFSKIGDRKSTRLNSSHVEISYAVFCLKKK